MSLVQRHAIEVGDDLLDHFPVTVIQGARQVGKSTLAGMLTAERDALAVTLDDVETLAAADADPVGFVGQHQSGTLVIDELHRRPELLRTIKADVDRNRKPGRFLLTGSADLLRVKGETDSLAGRAVTLRLHGMSQGEISGRREDFIDRVTSRSDLSEFHTSWRRGDYLEALRRGGFPEMQSLPERLRNMWLDGYLERVLERDAVMLPGGGQSARLRSVARLLAANQAGELVKGRIAEQAGIPATSIQAYLDALAAIYLVDTLPAWTPNLTRREVARPKSLVSDPALAMRLSRLTMEQLRPLTSRHIGGLIEGLAIAELRKQQGWSAAEFALWHFRTRTGLEIDTVVELDDGRVIGIEVKASMTYQADQFKGLRALRDQLGDRFLCGIVLGTAPHGYRYADRLWGLPLAALWEL